MKLLYILILKAYREGEFIDVIFMFLIVFLSFYKDTFLPNLLIPILFNDRLNYLVWKNKKEKTFYLQFDKVEFKKIIALRELFFMVEFNVIFLLISFFHDFSVNIKIDYWIILNIFLIVNFSLSNMIFAKSINNKYSFNRLIKFFMYTILNVFLVIIVFVFKTLSESSSILFFMFLILMFSFGLYILNTMFKKTAKYI